MKTIYRKATLTRLVLGLFLLASSAFVYFGQPATAFSKTATTQTDKQEQVVYITKTGKKFHKASCRYLKHSKIEVSRDEAMATGYTACKICRP